MSAGPVVGVVGGGQLARMLAEAASPLGVHLRVLAAPADEGAADVVPDVVIGRPDDPEALSEFARSVDVVTFDHENVDHAILASLEADGVAIRPGVSTLAFSDKAHQRRRFADAGLPVPDFVVVDPIADVDARERTAEFVARHGGRAVAKASRGGYDGRGVWMLDEVDVADFISGYRGAPLVLEPRLELDAEVAVLVARRPSGEQVTWPVVETVQVDGMCDEVVLPAPIDAALAADAARIAEHVAELTDAVGVLAVELFVVGGELLVNEIAPRVHNSGHVTIEACRTSQFEQHLRAVLDWPLGPTDALVAAASMTNVVGDGTSDPRDRRAPALAAVPEAHLHLYGEDIAPRAQGRPRHRRRRRRGQRAPTGRGAPRTS